MWIKVKANLFNRLKLFSKPHTDKTRRRERAQGLLEFAMILPLLLLFLLGVIEVGRMLAIYSSVSAAARQSARYGAVIGDSGNGALFYLDCAGMRKKAQATSFLQPLADTDIAIKYDHGQITQTFGSCVGVVPTFPLSDTVKDGDRIVISITTIYKPLVPIVPLPPLPMTFQAAHTIFTTITGPTPTPLPNADLQISKWVSPTFILSTDPDTLTYTLRITNTGPIAAINVVVTDTLGAGTFNITAAGGSGWDPCTINGLVVRCTLPFLGNGNSASPITIIAHAPRTPPGSLINTATVGNNLSDPNTSNNTATAVTFIDSWIDLELHKTSLVNPVAAGSNITYELTVKNNNWVKATDLTVTDTLPVSVTWVSYGNSGFNGWGCSGTTPVVCKRSADLLVGDTAPTIQIIVQAPNPGSQMPACHCVINTATATTTTRGDPYPSNNTNITNTTDISLDSDLVMSKSGPATANGGALYAYNLNAKNNGPSVNTSVTVTDSVPPGTTNISAAGSGWSCGVSGNLVTCTYTPVLAVGATTPDIVVNFRAPVADVVLVNTAYVSSTQTDNVPGNNSASVSTTVNSCHPEHADASRSSISALPTDVQSNGIATSRITVTLRDGCGVVLTSPTSVLVTLNNAGSDTVTLPAGFSNPTTNGVTAFDLKSTTAGSRTYTALAQDTFGVQAPVTISSATINWYDCVHLVEVPLGNNNQQFLTFTASNGTGISNRLTDLSLSWPGPGNNGISNGGKFQKVKLAGSDIWSGGSNSNPFVVNSSGWIAGTDALRTLANGASQPLRLETNFGVTGSPAANYSLTTTWDDGAGGHVCTFTLAFSH